jgi:hypothetical protein
MFAMKAFWSAVIAIVVIGVVGMYVIEGWNKSAENAYTTTGARPGAPEKPAEAKK